MELEKVGEKTYYIKNPTNIGIYKINDKDVYIIDSGNDKEAGKKILKIIEEQNWNVKGIINTHSNADHIGGSKVIQDRTHCKIFSTNLENAFTSFPILEPSFLYGGYPFKNLRNKFLMAKAPEKVEDIYENQIEGIEVIKLPGHFFDMIGIKTSDDIYFLADSLFSKETIEKYHIFFIYDVKSFLETLDYIETLEGKLFIPAHSVATQDIKELVKINREKVYDIIKKLLNICKIPTTFEEILKRIFENYQLVMNENQYVLVGSTIKSYLSYLHDEGKITTEITDNKMFWKISEE